MFCPLPKTRASRLVVWCSSLPLLALATAGAAVAQTRSDQPAVSDRDAEIRQLRQQLQELTRRLDALERGSAQAGPSPAAPTPGAPVLAQPAPPARAAEPQIAEEELGRALEATLLQRHVLVLPPWSVQLTPDAFYEHQRTSGLTAVEIGGVTGVATQDVRVDAAGADLTLRVGLPADAQAELVIPYEYERVRTVLGGATQSSNVSGLGDIQVGLTKQILEEREARPGLLASFGWKTTTGKTAPVASTVLASPTGTPLTSTAPVLSLGTGFDSLTGALTASKRQDPIVFYGTASYTANLPARSITPSDTFGFAIGAALAVNPATSLSADFATGFSGEDKVNGVKVPGSDQVIGIFELGASTVLSRRLVLNLGLGFGVTPNAPNFIFSVAVPYRF